MKNNENSQIRIFGAIVLLLLAAASTVANAQPGNKEKEKKSVVKVNKLDIIYEEEEYKGVVVDQKETDIDDQNYIYQAPFMVDDPDDDDDDETLRVYNSIDDDPAESEDEILMIGLDSTTIHVPKADISHMEPLTVDLGHFVWPTPLSARPTSHFGPRRRRFHYGLDLAQPTGEPIYAAFDGVVRISCYNRSYGHLVILRHANGLETYYAHMSKRQVGVGDHVEAGQVIGLTGNTGRSYGSHLHFEVRYEGNAINPEHMLSCATHDLVSPQITLTADSFRKRGTKGSGVTTGSNGSKYYRVRSGDTLSRIAKRNGTTVKRLCQLNGIKETTVLQIGRKLRIR